MQTSFETTKTEPGAESQQFYQTTTEPLKLQQRQMPMCAQCAQPITDQYVLRVHPDLEFHQDCLKCAECAIALDERAGSAFVRDGKILCRDDYIRLYSRSCQRCGTSFQPIDLVMRARQLLFHMNCFNCVVCHRQLMPGEQFLLRDNELFCRPECFMFAQQPLPPQFVPPPFGTLPPPPPPSSQSTANFQLDKPPPPMAPPMAGTPPFELAPLGNRENAADAIGASVPMQNNNNGNGNNFMDHSFARPQPAAGCQSVVSSGASPLSFSNPEDSLTPSSTNASTPTGNAVPNGIAGHLYANGHFGGHGQIAFETTMAGSGGGGGGGTSGSNCSSSSSSLIVASKHAMKKSKKDKPAQRVRTVLNETQLRMLRQTYSHNQRPDTITKDQLVERTGLNPRVIRVWFQNKRCKDKKRQLEQREKQQNQEKEQALRGARINGVGPMTVCSPAPLLLDSSAPSNNGGAHVYQPTPVEIHQIQQNPGLWSTSTSSNENDHHMVAAMSATATAAAPPLPPLPMDSPFHQQQLGMAAAIMSNCPTDFVQDHHHHHHLPANAAVAMLPPIPMFQSHAIAE